MEKVGLIAGNGKLPELFLNACQKKGIEIFSKKINHFVSLLIMFLIY